MTNTTDKHEQAVTYLQSLATLAVQAQEQVRAGRISSACDLCYDLRSDLERAEQIIFALESEGFKG